MTNITECCYARLCGSLTHRPKFIYISSSTGNTAAPSGLWESATTAEELVGAADETLFWKLRHCRHHLLVQLLPPESDTQHNLRKRRHNRTLPEKKGHLTAKNFIIRLLYKDTY